jgi:general stress protein YciG
MANQQNEGDTSKRGFASMDDEKQREIASKGGQSVPGEKRSFSQDPELASEAGRKGGHESGGNFKNDPERAAEAGRKGGKESGGNFANDRERAAEAGKRGGESRGS